MSSYANSINLPEVFASMQELRNAKVVAELSSGPVSRSWQLDTAMGPVVLRLDMPLAAKLGLDRSAEIDVLKRAAAAGIGPEFVWADPERGLLLTRLVPGRSWTEEDVSESANLVRLGALLSRLHSIPVVHESPDLHATLAIYSEFLNTDKARATYLSAEKLLTELSVNCGKPVFCHKDPHCRNIVDNGELRLVDWEYAGLGDPCFDLAVVVRQHQLKTWQLNCLLDGYGRSRNCIDSFRLQQFCRLYDYVAVLWYMIASSESLQSGSKLSVPEHYLGCL